MPEPEETTPEATEEPTRTTRGEKNVPSGHSVKEWVSVADQISDYSSQFAAGAMAHAGNGDEDIISREDFIRACEEFEKVEAF